MPNKPQAKQDAPPRALALSPVRMHNALVLAKQGFQHLDEKRILMAAVARLDTATTDKKTRRLVIRLSVRELIELYPVLGSDTAIYSRMKGVVKGLINCAWEAKEEYAPDDIEYTWGHWIDKSTYRERTGEFSLHFSPEVVPLLQELEANYTTYALGMTSQLRTLKSWRLLELLMQFRKDGWRFLTVEQLNEALEATDKQRKNWAEFRRRVLDPAVKELHDKEGWHVTYEPIKEGLKLKKLRFEFSFNAVTARNGRQRKAVADTTKLDTHAEVEKMRRAANHKDA